MRKTLYATITAHQMRTVLLESWTVLADRATETAVVPTRMPKIAGLNAATWSRRRAAPASSRRAAWSAGDGAGGGDAGAAMAAEDTGGGVTTRCRSAPLVRVCMVQPRDHGGHDGGHRRREVDRVGPAQRARGGHHRRRRHRPRAAGARPTGPRGDGRALRRGHPP